MFSSVPLVIADEGQVPPLSMLMMARAWSGASAIATTCFPFQLRSCSSTFLCCLAIAKVGIFEVAALFDAEWRANAHSCVGSGTLSVAGANAFSASLINRMSPCGGSAWQIGSTCHAN